MFEGLFIYLFFATTPTTPYKHPKHEQPNKSTKEKNKKNHLRRNVYLKSEAITLKLFTTSPFMVGSLHPFRTFQLSSIIDGTTLHTNPKKSHSSIPLIQFLKLLSNPSRPYHTKEKMPPRWLAWASLLQENLLNYNHHSGCRINTDHPPPARSFLMSDRLFQKYSEILLTGSYAKFSPEKLHNLHKELGLMLPKAQESLEPSELFDLYELYFHVSLLTNHDVNAKLMLDRFNDEFSGQRSQKYLILKSMYYEATGEDKKAVDALGQSKDELRASRRLATFSRYKADGSENIPEYIRSLVFYLNIQPSDTITWAELADQYAKIGDYEEAVFCLKEVLLHEPLAYNIFYKAGLYQYYYFLQQDKAKSEKDKDLASLYPIYQGARDLFLRAVEISASYTKAWVGLATMGESDLLDRLEKNKKTSADTKIQTFVKETIQVRELAKARVRELEKLPSDAEILKHLQ